MKSILAAALLSALTIPALAGEPKLDAEVFAPSVKLEMAEGSCSGTVIYSDRDKVSGDVATYVLTAKHCTKTLGEVISVQKTDYSDDLDERVIRAYPATTWGVSYASDLAIVKLDDKDDLWIGVASVLPKGTKLEYNQPVVITAYPAGASMTTTYGNLGFVEKVKQLSDVSQSTRFQRATPDIAPGSSGGALFTKDAAGDYKLIGTTTAGLRGFSFINMFTPIDEIRAYLDVASKSFAPAEVTVIGDRHG